MWQPHQLLLDFGSSFLKVWASLVAQMVKNLPAVQEAWVRSLGRDDSLEREMATHSSIYVYTQLLVEADWNCDLTDSKAIQVASYKVPSIRAT